jgi:hypothetical protein
MIIGNDNMRLDISGIKLHHEFTGRINNSYCRQQHGMMCGVTLDYLKRKNFTLFLSQVFDDRVFGGGSHIRVVHFLFIYTLRYAWLS